MDPDACLKELLELAETVRRDYEDGASNGVDQDDANRLGELVEALDEWIRKGGFMPTRWKRGRSAEVEVLTSHSVKVNGVATMTTPTGLLMVINKFQPQAGHKFLVTVEEMPK